MADSTSADEGNRVGKRAGEVVGGLKKRKPTWAVDAAATPADRWDAFYQRMGVKFYKDRNWLRREVLELMPEAVRLEPRTWCAPLTEAPRGHVADDSRPTVDELRGRVVGVEVGCGCGSAALPLLRANPAMFVFATDFAAAAIALLKERDEYVAQTESRPRRMHAWVADVAAAEGDESGYDWLEALAQACGGFDFVTLIFVLSALEPEGMRRALRRVAALLRPGGLLFVRDYGSGDLAQHRLESRGQKMGDDVTYERGEGTLAHYFAIDELRKLVLTESPDLAEREIKNVDRDITNRKKAVTMSRVWIQAKFVKKKGLVNHCEEDMMSPTSRPTHDGGDDSASPGGGRRDKENGPPAEPSSFADSYCTLS